MKKGPFATLVMKACLLLCLTPTTAIADSPQQTVATSSVEGDPSALFQRARDFAAAGHTASAIEILDALRSRFPQDVDYALARAQLYAREGRNPEALADLREAMILAPEYQEVTDLYARILAQQSTKDIDVVEWTVLMGGEFQRLDHDLPSWNRQFAEVSRSEKEVGAYRLGVSRDARYNNADVAISFGADRQLADDWLAGLSVAIAVDAEFQPERDYGISVGRKLTDGWAFNVRLRQRDYQTVSVTAATGTVEKYIGDYRFAYALGASRLAGASPLLNHGLTVNWFLSDKASTGVTFYTGDEAEAVAPGQVIETSVRGMTISARRQLNERFGLQLWLGIHDQGNYYRRSYCGLAVSIKL